MRAGFEDLFHIPKLGTPRRHDHRRRVVTRPRPALNGSPRGGLVNGRSRRVTPVRPFFPLARGPSGVVFSQNGPTIPCSTLPSDERVAASQLSAFREAFASRLGVTLADSRELHAASVREPGAFWETVWDELGVIGDRGAVALEEPTAMPGARFFPQSSLNFAENLLAPLSDPDGDPRRADDTLALVYSE